MRRARVSGSSTASLTSADVSAYSTPGGSGTLARAAPAARACPRLSPVPAGCRSREARPAGRGARAPHGPPRSSVEPRTAGHRSRRPADLAKHVLQVAARGHRTALRDQSWNRGRQCIGARSISGHRPTVARDGRHDQGVRTGWQWSRDHR
jgi:hypothetical protein